jgi:serine protease Do
VIEDASEIFVKIGSEKKVKAEIVKVNKDYDLVILKADIPSSKGVFLLNERNAMVGEEVFAIGTPLEKSLGQTVTRGIVSGYREMNGVDFIQTDVSINSGNSGGPLLSAKGEIIGINTLKVSGKNISGIGFAIPSDLVIKMLYIVN